MLISILSCEAGKNDINHLTFCANEYFIRDTSVVKLWTKNWLLNERK